MPIDRASALRNAEKLLRQGKLDLAIAEYVRVVEDQPRDWNTANALGDLLLRAGQSDKAIEQFVRIADSLNEAGFLPKASALYKKILKLKPDHEHALLQSAQIAASQGLLVDARAHLNAILDRRKSRGDERGASEIRIRLGTLDPSDLDARAAAGRARVGLGDREGALRDLKEVAAEWADKGRDEAAIAVLRSAAEIDHDDIDVRNRLFALYLKIGDFGRARECASSVGQLRSLAEALEAPGLAAEHLHEGFAGGDPGLMMAAAEIRLRAGALDEGMTLVRQMLEGQRANARGREAIAALGWTIAHDAPDAGFRVVDAAADVAVAENDWASGAAALQEFVTRVPNHIPALMRLVEICVDGGLEAAMYTAQAQLADAYIAAGSAAEARVISEDLVAREPWERANIERFRRALLMLGVEDPDALIADRLSGSSPFTSQALFVSEETSAPREPLAARLGATIGDTQARQFALGPNAIDLTGILGGSDDVRGHPDGQSGHVQNVEIDLSIVLDDIRTAGTSTSVTPALRAGEAAPMETGGLDGLFSHLRSEAERKSAIEAAERDLEKGLALRDQGHVDESIDALKAASRAPRLRFDAASALGRLYRERGSAAEAVEWLERAAQAPPPTPQDGHRLLYELADLLEKSGEVARALAICLELQADAGDYGDVAARIDRLAKVQARG